MTTDLEISLLPAERSADDALVAEITDLINEVYATAEEGLWLDAAARTASVEVAALIRSGQIAVARLDDKIVGSVRVQNLDGVAGEFGMLVADPRHRGIGTGRRLVEFAEALTRERGLKTMQLELLVPRTWKHPSKEFLRAWYTRIGYRPVRKGTIDEQYPKLAPLLATPCDFVIFHKALSEVRSHPAVP